MSEALSAPVTPFLAAPRRWLEDAPAPVFSLYVGLMAFGTYFAMYAFRKPFAVATFVDAPAFVVPYKVALVIAQVLGYALAKLVGVRVIAELPPRRRIAGIAMQIAFAEAMLVLFALVPAPWNIACMFLNGLSLGMIWGMVFGFVEGRRQSDAIGAMLCASFILSSGVVKSVGADAMLSGMADEWWMPALAGLVFTPMLAICLAGLALVPPPSAADAAERMERVPMDAAARRALVRRFGPGLVALIVIYVMLTALRDFRDNFAAEVWTEQGMGGQADLFSLTELPVSILVLIALAVLTVFRDNRQALAANFLLVGVGLTLTGATSAAFAAGWIGPVAWMTTLGGGLYLAYTPFNGMLFDRLVAASRQSGTAGFLIYLADSSGYVGSVALLLLRNAPSFSLPWSRFLTDAGMASGFLGLGLMLWAAHWFRGRLTL